MTNRSIPFTIRSKKLGVLIRAARLAAGRTAAECAAALDVPAEKFAAYELGEDAPSLPELEVLAYYLDTPPGHFWGREMMPLPAKPGAKPLEVDRLVPLRQRMIGAQLRQARLDREFSQADLAEKARISAERLATYELGVDPIPLPELEALAASLDRSMRDFEDNRGPVARWAARQRSLQHFTDLPVDLQDFVGRPVNRPYLELARRLSEMSVDKLRAVAEGLLEITY
jgi:transcriptional regulator with XRE-family HTH domain